MRITTKGKDLILTDVKDFSVIQTLECGQCFHFVKLSEGEYGVVYKDKLLHIAQKDNEIILYNTSEAEYESIWKEYFDLDRDYASIKKYLLKTDDKLNEAITKMHGVRILNQEFFETLISFIISQNKQIPHIKQIVATLSKRYGKCLGSIGDEEFYAFPTVEELKKVTLEELYECKTGFRAPYIYDAVDKVYNGQVDGAMLTELSEDEARVGLVSIKGVGDKVANCVMLFSLGFRSSFPVDVWIKRICENMYFKREAKKEEIQAFAKEHFGEYGGYAQQYLFYYGREMKVGK